MGNTVDVSGGWVGRDETLDKTSADKGGSVRVRGEVAECCIEIAFTIAVSWDGKPECREYFFPRVMVWWEASHPVSPLRLIMAEAVAFAEVIIVIDDGIRIRWKVEF